MADALIIQIVTSIIGCVPDLLDPLFTISLLYFVLSSSQTNIGSDTRWKERLKLLKVLLDSVIVYTDLAININYQNINDETWCSCKQM